MPIGFIVIGLVMLALSANVILSKWNSSEWPSTQGKVIQSEVESKTKSVRDSDGHGRRNVRYYSPTVEYEYAVAGQVFKSSNISVDSFSSTDPNYASSTVATYPLDSTVTVYYNPANPTDSLLQPGVGIVAWGVFLVGLLMIIAGSALGIWYYKNRKT